MNANKYQTKSVSNKFVRLGEKNTHIYIRLSIENIE